MRLAQARVRNQDMARDAVSETLLAGLEAPGDVIVSDRLRPWLAGVLKNKVVDQLRLYGPRGVVVADGDTLHVAEDCPDVDGDPAAALLRRQFLQALETAIGLLAAQQARCFVMREVAQESTAAICGQLGITPANAWVMSHRARQRLQVLMADWRATSF